MPRVFVVQKAIKAIRGGDGQTIKHASMFDLSPAEKFGDVEILNEPGDLSLMPFRAVKHLKEKLKNFSDNDFIIPMGDPVLIGATIAIASAMNHGKVKILRWDKHDSAYTPLEYDFGPQHYILK